MMTAMGSVAFCEPVAREAVTSLGIRTPWRVRRTRPPAAERRLLDSQLVVPAQNVLDQACPAITTLALRSYFEPSHRPQPRLQPAVVGLDPVVGVLLGSMPRCRQQLLQHDRVGRRPICGHLNGHHVGRADGLLKEPTSSLGVAPTATNTSITYPNWSIARSTYRHWPATSPKLGLVHEPAVTDGVPARSGRPGQQRREPLHPPVDRHVVDLDARSVRSSSTSR